MKQRAVVETIILNPLQGIPLIRSGDDLCTTIIESGIDMPTVNTLIVDGADRMGLGQLHRG